MIKSTSSRLAENNQWQSGAEQADTTTRSDLASPRKSSILLFARPRKPIGACDRVGTSLRALSNKYTRINGERAREAHRDAGARWKTRAQNASAPLCAPQLLAIGALGAEAVSYGSALHSSGSLICMDSHIQSSQIYCRTHSQGCDREKVYSIQSRELGLIELRKATQTKPNPAKVIWQASRRRPPGLKPVQNSLFGSV